MDNEGQNDDAEGVTDAARRFGAGVSPDAPASMERRCTGVDGAFPPRLSEGRFQPTRDDRDGALGRIMSMPHISMNIKYFIDDNVESKAG